MPRHPTAGDTGSESMLRCIAFYFPSSNFQWFSLKFSRQITTKSHF